MMDKRSKQGSKPSTPANGDQSQKFPYSSTPSGSPNLPSTSFSQGGQGKANMTLPVGELAPPQGHFAMPKIKKFVNVSRREPINTTTGQISPIPRNESFGHHVQFTDSRQFGSRKQLGEDLNGSIFPGAESTRIFGDNGSIMNGGEYGGRTGAVNGERRCTYPFPEVSWLDITPAGMLADNLQTLQAIKKMEAEKQRVMGFKQRKEKAEDVVAPYVFTKDTFNSVNSEGSIQAMHLLFSCYDAKETGKRFADCWPVYEKKLEGVFRRVALEWLKKLIPENPKFFVGVKMEALGGILVNAGGDRFMTFISQFTRLVMYTVADRKKHLLKQQILLPPEPTNDPEIYNRQRHVLKTRIVRNVERGLKEYEDMLTSNEIFEQRLACLDEAFNMISKLDEMYMIKVRTFVEKSPSLFGDITAEQMDARDQQLLEVTTEQIMDPSDAGYSDFVKERLEEVLRVECGEIYKSVTFLQHVIDDYSKLWHILEADKENPVVLDGDKIPPHQLLDESGKPSLNFFFDTFINTAKQFVNSKHLNANLPDDFLAEFENLCLRVDFLDMMHQNKAKEFSSTCKGKTLEEVLLEATTRRELLKARMDDMEWSKLSGYTDEGDSPLWNMSPVRIFDVNRSSGCTPGIQNFLDFSTMEQHLSVVRKRSVKRVVPRMQRRTSNSEMLPSRISDVSSISSGKPDISSTPVSSHLRERNRISRRSSNPPESSRLGDRKSVSFGESSLLEADISLNNRLSTSSSHSTTPNTLPFTHTTISSVEEGEEVSEDDQSTDVDEETQDRIKRLMIEIEETDLDEETLDRINKLKGAVAIQRKSFPSIQNENLAGEEDVEGITELDQANLNISEGAELELFGSLSMVDDWTVNSDKGIMDVSNIELSRNSDSDE